MEPVQWETVKAWTETKATRSLVARPYSTADCHKILAFAKKEGLSICPRGSGYSFGDLILNDHHMIMETRKMNQILHWDRETGVMVVQPGVTVSQILAKSLMEGWTLPSCTGGIGVSAGGALSNNVHGKDSWKLGNFGDQVVEMNLMTANGEVTRVSRQNHPELFRTVIGGMGLLGIILEVTLQLRKVPSPFVEARTIPVRNLEESLEVLEEARSRFDFLMAWVDTSGRNSTLGRGAVEVARWVQSKRTSSKKEIEKSLKLPRRVFGLFPAALTWSIAKYFFYPPMIKAANLAKYGLHRLQGKTTSEILFPKFNFMLNKIPHWEMLYRPHGYVELQPIVPRSSGLKTLKEILGFCRDWGTHSLVCAVKPHRADDYLLSFEGDGYDVAIGIPLRNRRASDVANFARDLYTYVAECGGKAFLAKDEVLPKELFQRMYPKHREFVEVKRSLDPQTVFSSDLYRRLLA